MNSNERADASRQKNEAQTDRLLTFQQVNELIGSTCRTSHTVRQLAKRGQLAEVRLNERVIRYRESSVRALIEGRAPVVSAGRKEAA